MDQKYCHVTEVAAQMKNIQKSLANISQTGPLTLVHMNHFSNKCELQGICKNQISSGLI